MSYATVEDMTALWRPMTAAEQARASPLLEVVSASLNVEAARVGKDLPALTAADEALALVACSSKNRNWPGWACAASGWE